MANKQPLELKSLVDLVGNHINTVTEIDTAMCIYSLVQNRYKTYKDKFWVNCIALASIYNIGRINGIREERKKRNGKRNRNQIRRGLS